MLCPPSLLSELFFFNDTATTEIYTYCTLFPYTTLFRSPESFDRRQYAGFPTDDCDANGPAGGCSGVCAGCFGAAGGSGIGAPHGVRRQPDPRLRPGVGRDLPGAVGGRSEEHTSELQSLMRSSYAVFCLQKKNQSTIN